ncbi:MAG: hypothetical protein ACK52I_11520 [Pseudomonadota bacterium]
MFDPPVKIAAAYPVVMIETWEVAIGSPSSDGRALDRSGRA